jgi:deoxycytidylate deaminase
VNPFTLESDKPLVAKQTRLDLHHLRQAFLVALDRSKDPSTKVAAIILAPDGKKMSCGYNGMVAGAPESDAVWHDRDAKYRRVIHAELNSILNCPFETSGCTIYCTLHPCAQCLKLLIQAGIKRIVHYGAPWERDPDWDVSLELQHMVVITRYDNDSIIEGLKELYNGN